MSVGVSNITPRDYQKEAYRACAESIKSYSGPFFVDASVGAGKTVIMAMIAARAESMGLSVMILARRGELVEQNSATLWQCGIKNSIYSASVGSKSKTYPVIVGTEGTVARAIDSDLKNFSADICIIDESHEVNFEDHETQYMQIIAALKERNPRLRIIGMTGSPYRGSKTVLGEFWRECVYKISTEKLVNMGFLVPTFFGFEQQKNAGYDLAEFKTQDNDTHKDFTSKELLAMQRKITKDETVTQSIVREVVALTKDRNGVMITGAGKKHLEQIAGCLEVGSWAIITESTGSRERSTKLKAIRDGKIKFLLQVGCLTTGFDAPIIDTSVIMRKIGSLTLLVQLLGRGMRLLKPEQIERGITKNDHLVLDYSDTMLEMAEKYHNPILEEAQKSKAREIGDLKQCPACGAENSPHAQRCTGMGEPSGTTVGDVVNFSIDGRCEFFWTERKCPECNTSNAANARECRKCGYQIFNPDANLRGKHYQDNDWREVVKMCMKVTRGGDGVLIEYFIIDAEPPENSKKVDVRGQQCVVATEVFFPARKEKWMRAAWSKFVTQHLHRSWYHRAKGKKAPEIVKMAAIFDTPTHITHRVRDDKKSIIHRKKFLSGREEETTC